MIDSCSYSIDVIFRKWPDGTIDALFPYEAEFNYKVQCYSRIGQHGIADYDHCIRQTKPASPDEYKSLYDELTSLGYIVTPIKRVNKDRMLELQRALNNTLTMKVI